MGRNRYLMQSPVLYYFKVKIWSQWWKSRFIWECLSYCLTSYPVTSMLNYLASQSEKI